MRNLVALLFLVSCSGSRTEPATTTHTAATATADTPVVVADDPVVDAWKTGPEDQYIKAAECPSFTRLPARIDKNTLVEGPCIELAAGATLTIPQDRSLVIIATRKFRIGDGSKIMGRGTNGAAGAPAQVDSKEWAPSGPDQSAKINCACRNIRCKPGWQQCNADNDSELQGGRGGPGRAGAKIFIVARELIVGSGVSIELGGGLGGEPGKNGHVDCRYGGTECSATATSLGDGEGGPAGTIAVRAALMSALPMMIAIERVTTPPSAVNKHVVDTMGSFRSAVAEAHEISAKF